MRKPIANINEGEEGEVTYDDINEAINEHSAKSTSTFEVLYELVEDSVEKVSDKSKKWLWQNKVTEDTKFQYTQQNNIKKWDKGIINKLLNDTIKKHTHSRIIKHQHASFRAQY